MVSTSNGPNTYGLQRLTAPCVTAAASAGASVEVNAALVGYSRAKTGRSPNDKYIVNVPASKNDIGWRTLRKA